MALKLGWGCRSGPALDHGLRLSQDVFPTLTFLAYLFLACPVSLALRPGSDVGRHVTWGSLPLGLRVSVGALAQPFEGTLSTLQGACSALRQRRPALALDLPPRVPQKLCNPEIHPHSYLFGVWTFWGEGWGGTLKHL